MDSIGPNLKAKQRSSARTAIRPCLLKTDTYEKICWYNLLYILFAIIKGKRKSVMIQNNRKPEGTLVDICTLNEK
jgi:hypothetical protein